MWIRASADSEARPAGMFGNKTGKVHDHRSVDMDQFSALLGNAYNQLDSDGHDVVNVIPLRQGPANTVPRKAERMWVMWISRSPLVPLS